MLSRPCKECFARLKKHRALPLILNTKIIESQLFDARTLGGVNCSHMETGVLLCNTELHAIQLPSEGSVLWNHPAEHVLLLILSGSVPSRSLPFSIASVSAVFKPMLHT